MSSFNSPPPNDLAFPPHRPLLTNYGMDVTNLDTYTRSPSHSPDHACSPNRPYLMNSGIDMTKTAPLSAAADASGSDSPAEKTRPEIESSQSKENQTAPSYAGKMKLNENPRNNCNCSPVSALRATDAPFLDNKFYCQVSERN